MFVGEELWTDIWGGDYKDEIIDSSDANGYTTVGIPSLEYTIETLYDRDWLPNHNWPKSKIINKINNKVHIINHLGHANEEYNMKMGIADVDTLTNNQYCFIYSQGCYAGAFDTEDCIAEHFTIKNTHGAVAGVWNSRYGWGDTRGTNGPSQHFDREFFDAIYGESQRCYYYRMTGYAQEDSKNDNIWRLNITQWDSYENLSLSQAIRWSMYCLNLFGDPQLEIKQAQVQTHDLAVIHIDVPKYSLPDEDFPVKAKIKNKGTNAEIDVRVWVEVDGILEPGTETTIDYIGPNDIAYFTFNVDASYAKHNVSVHVEIVPGETKGEDNSLGEPVIADHIPEKPATPWGPTNVIILKPYVYNTKTSDQDTTVEGKNKDKIQFKWKWDTDEDPWTWWKYSSNETASRVRVWITKGSHTVQVKAVDRWGRESNWSDPLTVKSPFSNRFDIYTYVQFVTAKLVSIHYDTAIMQEYEQSQTNSQP